MKKNNLKKLFIFSLTWSVIVLSGYRSENQLAADANTLCDAFEPTHLKNEYEGMWLSDVEKAVYEDLEEDIKTDEVKAVIAGRSEIGNYAEVYPFIKTGIEDVMGAPWSCQNMASFYDLEFVPATSPAQETASILEIQQVEGLIFLADDVEIDFSNPGNAADVIRDNFGESKKVTIRFSGESQDGLPQILEVMTEIGVQDVKTVTPAC